MQLRRISVVIANYNYAQFVGTAIESALALQWSDVEVIVVDDGSTDESRIVIDSFGDRIRTVFQPQLTQRVARNVGFALSTGDAIIHLDSDDVLMPDLPIHVSRVWRAGISKVQVLMERINANGDSLSSVLPRMHGTPSPSDIRRWAESTTAYPTPPGSGNIYSRTFLEKIFPLDDRCGPATDSACLAVAPFLGDVVTIAKPLVKYRVHDSNASNLLADRNRFANAIARARARYSYAQVTIDPTKKPDERRLNRSRGLLQLRVAARTMTPDLHPLPCDGRPRMLVDSVLNLFAPGAEGILHRVAVAGWCLLTLLAPPRTAEALVRFRYRRK